MLVERTSPLTGKINVMDLDITEAQIAEWEGGKLIQNVFPHLNADEREFLMTGLFPGEWDQLFPEREEDADDFEDVEFGEDKYD